MRRDFESRVAVITGASSGIGRATAHAFAEQGATVVLAARREDALRSVERSCIERGGRALAEPTDVTDHEQVEALARTAVQRCGRIDYWVNNAGVGLFGRIDEVPLEDYERVLQTNLHGCIYGARAVVPQFRRQGQGTLINVASLVGALPQPYTSAYSVSKAGLRALGESLRMELMDEPEVHACTVLPASIDTPFFQHAANYTGRSVKPIEPVYPAAMVADSILQLAQKPQREVVVGGAGKMFTFQHTVAPALAERTMAQQVERNHFAAAPSPATRGNLFTASSGGGRIGGGWMAQTGSRSSGTSTRAVLTGAALVALPLAAWAARNRISGGRLWSRPGSYHAVRRDPPIRAKLGDYPLPSR